jgi:hypothetical protein
MDTEKQKCIYKYSSFGLLGFEPQPKTFESYWLKALCKASRERGMNFTDEIKVVQETTFLPGQLPKLRLMDWIGV